VTGHFLTYELMIFLSAAIWLLIVYRLCLRCANYCILSWY